jgi:hypothetical protein
VASLSLSSLPKGFFLPFQVHSTQMRRVRKRRRRMRRRRVAPLKGDEPG